MNKAKIKTIITCRQCCPCDTPETTVGSFSESLRRGKAGL